MSSGAKSTRGGAPRAPAVSASVPAESAPSISGVSPVEIVFAESISWIDPALIAALQSLQATGVLRVAALVDGDDMPRQLLRHAFPDAVLAASVQAAAVGPGAVVLLRTPPHLHATEISAAVKRGWHVLSLSPLARTSPEATAILAAAQRQQRLVAAAFPRRFVPALHYLRVLCRDHLLGPVITFNIHEGVPPTGSDVTVPPEGVLTEPGIQVLDVLLWCLGGARVVNYADDAMGGVEANALIDLAFAEGVTGRVHLSREWATPESYEFVFERGFFRWQASQPNRLILQIASAPCALSASLTAPIGRSIEEPCGDLPASATEMFVALIRNFIGATRGRERLQIGVTDALDVLAVVDECYRRRELLNQPWLSAHEQAHARRLGAASGAFRR